MNLGHGSTKRERPRRAFEGAKDMYSKKLDFGQSNIPEGNVYRARWVEKKSWFWTIVKVAILLFIMTGLIVALFDL